MAILVGVLAILVIVQEIRYDRVVKRMLLQANIPSLAPARTSPPPSRNTDPIEQPDTRRKLFSAKIPH